MNLSELGWSNFFQRQIQPEESGLMPARVFRQDINRYHLVSESGSLLGVLPGRFRRGVDSKADLPAVGDWVLVLEIVGGEAGQVRIERRLDRKSKFSRKGAGDAVDEQVVAANLDKLFVVSGLDGDFNPKRIERYLLAARNAGAMPVIVLNKRDICGDLEAKLEALRPIAGETPVHEISALKQRGLDVLRGYLAPGVTCALAGSSGVGKSTIINALLGEEKFATAGVREDDSKGRHTTSFREMIAVPGGGLIIDTPGMRELQIWAGDVTAERNVDDDDIETLAASCKFNDCKHQSEPGCAVRQAVEQGLLDKARLNRYFRLQHIHARK